MQVFPLFFRFQIWSWPIVLFIALGFPIALMTPRASKLTSKGLQRTDSDDDLPARLSGNRVWVYVIIAGVALSIGLFFVGRYTAIRQGGTLPSPAKSIAVLPFENLSRDPDNAYFADGV